jgi:hypothetical protein
MPLNGLSNCGAGVEPRYSLCFSAVFGETPVRDHETFPGETERKLNETSQGPPLPVPSYIYERFLHWRGFCV